jgi:hypothetical protein
MNKLISLSLLFLVSITPASATQAKQIITSYTIPAILPVTLDSGQTVWIHGRKPGCYVTLASKPILPGSYRAVDGGILVEVNSEGKLLNAISRS